METSSETSGMLKGLYSFFHRGERQRKPRQKYVFTSDGVPVFICYAKTLQGARKQFQRYRRRHPDLPSITDSPSYDELMDIKPDDIGEEW